MPQITQKIIDFATDAYHVLKDVPREEGWTRCYTAREDYSGPETMLHLLMLRTSSYYGDWTVYERGSYVASFDGKFLASVYEAREKARAERAAQREAEAVSK